jgi:sulfotransferase family protein
MWLQHPDDSRFRHRARLPQFLVISPPKTGSTWLAYNLRRHPQLFLPTIKEVKYFSSLYKWLDLGWYADHFLPAGERIAGEASPSYALLPVEQIQAIRRLLPDVKLIFLMRDPISRAWSHAKHCHRYWEANFKTSRSDYGDVTEAEWEVNFFHDWTLTNSDYLGQLKRWSSVFPREQMYVGFYESIATRPVEMLREMFAFLGADPDVDLSTFPISERILQGQPGELTPRLEAALHRLLYARTVETVEFIRNQLNLVPPPEWQRTLTPPNDPLVDPVPKPFRPEEENTHLRRLLEQEEECHWAYRHISPGYLGYDLVFYRGRLIAIPQAIGGSRLPAPDETALSQLISEGTFLVAPTLAELKDQVTNRVVDGQEARLREATTELQALRAQLGNLHAELQANRTELGNLNSQLQANRDQTAHRFAELTAAIAELQRPSRVRLLARRVKHAGRRLMT